ncbi:hypothetical protein D915_008877 [Fasciola hepatica]|uniref:CWH43-like N-terminal domain-containing protein n=1 Tax=Fasciola hepatica TaxID=6192 RepID=A0A4E0RX80_FASHE|nr:hypothetical protein D915_008877 [Fasciola hepatica]
MRSFREGDDDPRLFDAGCGSCGLYSSVYSYGKVFGNALHEAHRNSLAIFVFSSVLYMICDTCLFSLLTQHVNATYMVKRKRTKQFLLATYVLSLCIVALCYFVHTAYCPPYVYSIFSFFEYVGIVINVCYHYTVYRFIENRPLYTVLDYWSSGTDFTEMESLNYSAFDTSAPVIPYA